MGRIKVGVVGIGTMGRTHLDAYARCARAAEVVALADIIPDRLTGAEKVTGNIPGQAAGALRSKSLKLYDEGMKLIADPQVELVDICLTTPLHVEYALAALKAGKHVMVEKPLARTSRDAAKLTAAAQKAKTFATCGLCMRFWPGWTWLKEAVAKKTYGPVRSASFRRLSASPGGPFYTSGKLAGGAILDLHIHDTDFVHYCFGLPRAVHSIGYRKTTSAIDHVLTYYDFGREGPMVVAEGGWAMADGFGFQMHYTVNFERATAVFNFDGGNKLTVYQKGKPAIVPLPPDMGYQHEIAYLLRCIASGTRPSVVTMASAALSVRIVEAEVQSIASGKPVKLDPRGWGPASRTGRRPA
jgi:predicted dehydrogenase